MGEAVRAGQAHVSLLTAEVRSTQARQEASDAANRESFMGLQRQLDSLKAELKPQRPKPQRLPPARASSSLYKKSKPTS
eukprot:14940859-Alexandrium_andersonii.AAC.1